MVRILRPRKAHQTPPAKEKMRIRPPRPLTAPFSTNLQIRQFLGSLQRLSNYINGGEQLSDHITIWPHPIGFANGIKRLNWTKDFPYLAEYSYFAECFRKKAPGRMWAGFFVTAIESWVGKKVLAEWHVWAAIIISPKAPATGKKLLIYDCDGEAWTLATVVPGRPSLFPYSAIFGDRKRCRSRNCGVPATIRKPFARISA
ncbi:hypothetical protein B0H14DRAFT_3676408 [Mycena olivaceomarginata]|nr:hypothetical protein B0H14DRAFT_3676408 [Mycena olivaceomarginata]